MTTLYTITVPIFTKMLQNLSQIIDKGVLHAQENNIDVDHLFNDRLAPDQWPFSWQVHVAANTAIRAVAGIAHHEFPNEILYAEPTSMDDLKAIINQTLDFLSQFTSEHIEGKEETMIEVYYSPGKYLPAFTYVTEYMLPNFFFHMTTAYAILRHNGVPLGKADYIGSLVMRDEKE